MMKAIKSIAEYFPLILDYLNKYKAWGIFVCLLAFFCGIVSVYAYNQSTDTEKKVYGLEKTMNEKHSDDANWRNTITNRLDVMDGKLDLLIELKKGGL